MCGRAACMWTPRWGWAGTPSAIARRLGGEGRLICFDRDPEAMAQGEGDGWTRWRRSLGAEMPQVVYVPRAFSEAARRSSRAALDGLLADFGVSSLQLDEAHRGFSFRSDGPLDMRMDTRSGETAEQVVNQEDEEELADLIYEFGEERRSRRIARAIVRARPISTTAELAQSDIGRGPINERRQDSSGDTDLSGTSDSCE